MRLQTNAGASVGQADCIGTVIWMNSTDSISASTDWATSLSWIDSWRCAVQAKTYADFVMGQAFRHALQARSVKGIWQCVAALLRVRRVPTLRTIVLGFGGIVPREWATRVAFVPGRMQSTLARIVNV
jgi:hypothetical protein